jgi:hypothetical protein
MSVYECTLGDAIRAHPEHLHRVLQAGSLLELKKALERLRQIEEISQECFQPVRLAGCGYQ